MTSAAVFLTVGAGLAAGLGGATTITPIIAILVTTIAQTCVWPMYRDLFGPKNTLRASRLSPPELIVDPVDIIKEGRVTAAFFTSSRLEPLKSEGCPSSLGAGDPTASPSSLTPPLRNLHARQKPAGILRQPRHGVRIIGNLGRHRARARREVVASHLE